MEIPKLKILIYVLTFIGYAWSGYGSGILLNLRDAILSAETFFGDFLGNILEYGRRLKLHDVLNASLEEKCIFRCPLGNDPVKNKFHRPLANGCGPDILKFEAKEYFPTTDLTHCCNKHDICYDTCNNKKDDCDAEFQKCLYKLCEKVFGNEPFLKACKGAAKLMFTSTLTLGCQSYLDSQKKACHCPVDKKKKFMSGDEL